MENNNENINGDAKPETFGDQAANIARKIPVIRMFFDRRPRVAVLRLSGIIAEHGVRRRGSFSYNRVASAIDKAFDKNVKAVALEINSPGGSPVQSTLIAAHIRRLSEEKNIPVYAFAEDVAASGGYWLACAADEIYAQDSSIIGSIGVISASFGFDEAIERHGIKRRVYTAGKDKSFLDPFLPESDKDVKRLKELQGEIHDQFRHWVKTRRCEKLSGTDKALFEGAFWTGATALEKGLVDGIHDKNSFARAKFGEDVKFIDCSPEKSFLPSFLGGSAQAANFTGLDADSILATLEDRAFWARYGL